MSRNPKIPLSNSGSHWNSPFEKLTSDGLPAGKDPAQQAGKPAPVPPVRRGRVVLRRETAHRGGKTVVVIYDFEPQVTQSYIEELSGKVKRACGCGGTVRDRTIEIQGDQPGKIRALLEAEGFRVAGVH